MKDLKPAVFVWDAVLNTMHPAPEYNSLCARQFVNGGSYRFLSKPERTAKEHAFFMAVIDEAWQNLPESKFFNTEDRTPDTFQSAFPTPDHLRYWALIRCGFADEKTILIETDGDAQRLVDYFAEAHTNMLAERDGRVVRIWTAHSQNKFDGMDREEFRKAMDAVFKLLSDMLGVNVTELKKNAGRTA